MLAKVAAILRPIIPDLPIPVITVRPGHSKIKETAAAKLASTRGTNSKIASASMRNTSCACLSIASISAATFLLNHEQFCR